MTAANTGTLIGRLANDPKAFENKDGSKKVLITLYVDRPYKKDGKTISDAISTEAFVNKATNGLGPFGYAHKGDLVAVSTHIEQMAYDVNGETKYPAPKIVIDDINFLESRNTTQARLAKRTVEGAEGQEAATESAPAGEGNKYEEDSPFAEAAAS